MSDTKPENIVDYLPSKDKTKYVTLYTIGYSVRSLKTVVNMLLKHGIEKVVDIRFYRYSRNSDFNGNYRNLALTFLGYGIDYEHRREFGNHRSLHKLFRNDRTQWSETFFSRFTRGDKRLYQDLFTRQITVLMCSEKKIRKCHRLEVANWLSRESNPRIHVKHL